MAEKRLASLDELRSSESAAFMKELNRFARKLELQEYVTFSRIWEYPWLWNQLRDLKGKNLRILDIGSEQSAFPWFLAAQGFQVIISDVTGRYQDLWRSTARRLRDARVSLRILDSQDLDLSSGSIDVYLSVSVLEHVPDKQKAIAEAARVLRPGGLLLMTFDICEAEMGMTFPEWNGRAINMSEFDELFASGSWFEPGLSQLKWNRQDLPEYYAWHRGTALHHNYATGSAAVRRAHRIWPAGEMWRGYRSSARAFFSSASWHLRRTAYSIRTGIRKAAETLIASPAANRIMGELFFRVTGARKSGSRDAAPRILVIRPDEIGDLIFFVPFLRELRKQNPGAFIALIVKPSMRNLIETCPYIDEILTFDWGIDVPLPKYRLQARTWELARKELWKRRFDTAMVPRYDTDYYHASFLAYWSGAAKRIGYSETVSTKKRVQNAGYDSLYTEVRPAHEPMHEVNSNLAMLGMSPGGPSDYPLELQFTKEDEQAADQLLETKGFADGELLVAFGIGARVGRRKWPLVRFLETANWLNSRYGARIVVVGGPDDADSARELESAFSTNIISLAGPATLRQSCCILKRCRLFIGNDSGPAHLAAASGIPVICISCHPANGAPDHFNSPVRIGPWHEQLIVLQPQQPVDPCSHACEASVPHCILEVTAGDVCRAASRFPVK